MRHLDFNLLRLLDALMTERSVTRTGERLGITQSAVSHGLRRLRDMIGDPLFVRGPDGLQPTERMRAIAPGLRDGFARLRDALSVNTFDPDTSDRLFTIAAVSYVCATLVPGLIARIMSAAPHVRIRLLTLPDELSEALASGAVDLAIGSFLEVPARLRATTLFSENSVWVVREGHPILAQTPGFEELLALPQVAISAAADVEGVRGQIVAGGVRRRILVDLGDHLGHPVERAVPPQVIVYDVRTALTIVRRTDFAAVVPRRLVEAALEFGSLSLIEPDPPSKALQIQMLWHRELGEEASTKWLRNMVEASAREASASEALAAGDRARRQSWNCQSRTTSLPSE